ncbi:MAG TPA: hypothetical protein VMU89_23525 [Thermomicrobiaceae bacterium]|nr:hypothetical protein [Thermomicrobiaceae bacterium]
MVHTAKTIHVEPGSALDRALDEAGEAAVELERRGVRYRLTRIELPAEERDIWAGYDAERVRAGLRQSADALVGVDRDRLLEDLAGQREQDSRGRPA